ncbi:MAG: IPT/TIG domain-containing protein [Terriglobales bacterium]
MRFTMGFLLIILIAVIEVSCGGQPQIENICVPPVPRLDVVEPQSAKTHSPSLLLTVRGSNFVPASVIFFDGRATPTTYISPQQLRSVVPFDLLLKVGPISVDVFNPQDTFTCQYGRSQSSNAMTFTLTP